MISFYSSIYVFERRLWWTFCCYYFKKYSQRSTGNKNAIRIFNCQFSNALGWRCTLVDLKINCFIISIPMYISNKYTTVCMLNGHKIQNYFYRINFYHRFEKISFAWMRRKKMKVYCFRAYCCTADVSKLLLNIFICEFLYFIPSEVCMK